jgi:FG-GAP-like repeat
MKRTIFAICTGLACPLSIAIAIAVAIMLSVLLVDVPQAQAQAVCTPPISNSGCAVGVLIADPSTGQDCVAGSCPAGPAVPFGGDQGTSFTSARSFTTDNYEVVGNVAVSETVSGTTLGGGWYLRIKFLGGVGLNGQSTQTGTFVVHVFAKWTLNGNQSNLSLPVMGSFSPGTSTSSNVSASGQYTTQCGTVNSANVGPITPPGSFSGSTEVTIAACSGTLQDDITYHVNFGVGTQPGSYIEVGTGAAPALADTHDLNGDRASDIVWIDGSGNTAVWFMNGTQLLQSAGLGAAPGWSVVGKRDFNGDGISDLLWRDGTGDLSLWLMDSQRVLQTGSLGNVPLAWTIYGTRDFNGDGKADILWKDSSGNVAIWLMNAFQITQSAVVANVGTNWNIVGNADFNGDGKGDILWRDNSGNVAIWLMNGLQVAQSAVIGNIAGTWSVAGTGDFNGDGKSDILWIDNAGNVAVWLMNGLQVMQTGGLGNVGTAWSVKETGDYNGDGISDLLWRDSTGNLAIWFINGLQIQVLSTANFGTVPSTWVIQGTNSE